MAIARPMLEEEGNDSNKTRDQRNWTNLSLKGYETNSWNSTMLKRQQF